MKTPMIAALLLILLGACSPDPVNTPKIAEQPREVLENAKGLEAQMNQDAQEQLERIDAQTE